MSAFEGSPVKVSVVASNEAHEGSVESVERTRDEPDVELKVPGSNVHTHAWLTRATGGRCAWSGYTRFGGVGAAKTRFWERNVEIVRKR
jgi:hypothetical protein